MKTTAKRGYKKMELTDAPDISVFGESLDMIDTDVAGISSQIGDLAKIFDGAKVTSLGYTNWNSNNVPIETGNWTPRIFSGEGEAASAYYNHYGSYKRISNMVYIAGCLEMNGFAGTPTGMILVKGLPYPPKLLNTIRYPIINLLDHGGIKNMEQTQVSAVVDSNADYIALKAFGIGKPSVFLTFENIQYNFRLYFGGIYFI